MSRSSFHSNMNTIMMLLCYYLIIVSDFGEFYLKNKRPGTNIMRPTNTIKSLLSLLHQPVEQSNVPVGWLQPGRDAHVGRLLSSTILSRTLEGLVEVPVEPPLGP